MHAEFAMSFSPLLCSLLPISLSLSLSFSLSPLLFSFSLPLCMILSHNSTMTIMLQPRHVMQCRRVCFALPCYEMPCPWFLSLRCGLCACYSHYSSSFFFCIAIICGFQYFRALSSFQALHAMPAMSWNCHAIVLMLLLSVVFLVYGMRNAILVCSWGLACYHTPCAPTFACILLDGLIVHSCLTHAIPTRVSLGCDRHRGFVLCKEAHSKGHVARWAARRGH